MQGSDGCSLHFVDSGSLKLTNLKMTTTPTTVTMNTQKKMLHTLLTRVQLVLSRPMIAGGVAAGAALKKSLPLTSGAKISGPNLRLKSTITNTVSSSRSTRSQSILTEMHGSSTPLRTGTPLSRDALGGLCGTGSPRRVHTRQRSIW